jgi:Flp pilus assembly protein TadB
MALLRVIFLLAALVAAAMFAFNFVKLALFFACKKIYTRKTGKHSSVSGCFERGENSLNKLRHYLLKRFRGTFVEKHIRHYANSKYAKKLRDEMPEALRLLCIALDSGNSLVQAFKYAAENCNEPLSRELKRAVWDLEAGLGFDEAMEHLRTRCGSSEFAYLAAAMEIQHSSGGSMSSILQSVSASLQQSIEMEQKLDAKTAQARLSSKIVAIMPFALLGILMIFSPGYLGMFFSSALGILMFVCALGLEAIGIILIRRFLNLDINAHLGGELV